MTEKKSFIFYPSWMDACELMSVEEKIQYIDAIVQYGTEGTVPEGISPSVRMAMSFVKNDIDINTDKHEKTITRRREAGARGGAPKGNKNASKQAKQANGCENKQNNQNEENKQNKPYVDVYVDVDVDSVSTDTQMLSEKEIPPRGGYKEKPQLFEPPTLEDITVFSGELASAEGVIMEEEVNSFFQHYTANGWVLSGGVKMNDWKAAFMSWLSKVDRFPAKKPRKKKADTQQQARYEVLDTRKDMSSGKKGMDEYMNELRMAFDGDNAMRAKYPNWKQACTLRGISQINAARP